VKWTEEKIWEEAKKYSTRIEFQKKSNNAYHAALNKKIIDKVCSHMIKLRNDNWTYDELKKIAEKYEVYKDFKQEDRGSSAIVILNPINNKITLFPQDWYNQDETMDFGYQWIARADRNKSTGRIQIQGTRIGEFYLDETNRRLGW
jgi:hypothetical protein